MELIATAKIPTWAICAIINGDYSGMKGEDIEILNKWLAQDWLQGVTLDVVRDDQGNADEYFSWFPEFGLPAMVEDVNIWK